MSTSSILPPIDDLKLQAKALRAERQSGGTTTGHSQSLELIAKQYGYRDWNTLHAASENQTADAILKVCPVAIGDRVTGLYLGQAFEASVLNMVPLESGDLFRVTMHFDEPVDVVTHDSFSSFRQRVTGNIDHKGVTPQKTSNGRPQIVLHVGENK